MYQCYQIVICLVVCLHKSAHSMGVLCPSHAVVMLAPVKLVGSKVSCWLEFRYLGCREPEEVA